MLHSITSDLETFQRIDFKPGFNLVVAEGQLLKNGKGSANSVGKSSVFLLIDYLLGGRHQEAAFPSEYFGGASFTLDATIGGNRVQVTRSMAKDRSKVVQIRGSVEGWPELTDAEMLDDVREISVTRWCLILGKLCFDIPDVVDGAFAREAKPPSARDLFTCFNRKSFSGVVRAFPQQSKEKGNFLYAYLMNLNWTYLATLIGLKKEEFVVKSINETIKFEKIRNSLGNDSVQRRVAKIDSEIEGIQAEMGAGRVSTLFDSSVAQVDELTVELREAQRQVANANRRIALAENSLHGIEDDVDALVEFYREARVDLGDAVVRKLEEVRKFHADVRNYRASILRKEIDENRKVMTDAKRRAERLDEERAKQLLSPEVKTALGDFAENQRKLAGLFNQVNEVRQVHKLEQDAQNEKARLSGVKDDLVKTESDRFSKCQHLVDEFSNRFKALMELLCPDRAVEPTLEVQFMDGVSAKGKRKQYAINIDARIKSDGGPGMAHLKVCAFDAVLFEMTRRFGRGIDFLLHDSPAFESTDMGHIARLFLRIAQIVRQYDSQYLCAIDSDRLKTALEKESELRDVLSSANQIRLSQEHMLFGFPY